MRTLLILLTALPAVVSAQEAVVVGTTRYDLQHNFSMGKMIAISSDGVAHLAFMGGANTSAGRRVLSACVDRELVPVPATSISDTRAGYVTVATTGPEPGNGLAPNCTVVGFHTSSGSQTGAEMDICTSVYDLAQMEDSDQLWPHIAMDYQDRLHVATRDSEGSRLHYQSSDDLVNYSQPHIFAVGSDPRDVISTACKTGPGAALVWPDRIACDGETSELTGNILAYVTWQEENDLGATIEAGPPQRLTNYGCPGNGFPFSLGAITHHDVDAIFDQAAVPDLHVAWPTRRALADTMIIQTDGEWGRAPFVNPSTTSCLWHSVAGSGLATRIAGRLTHDDGAWTAPTPGERRLERDQVQLGMDQSSGRLYAVWNQYSADDQSADGFANGEIYAACSADSGRTWGEPVNLTNSHSPGCVSPDCSSEIYASLAESVQDGYLHLTFQLDKCAGSSIMGLGLETVNNVYYLRVPVEQVPPADGPTPGAGVGLADYQRSWHLNVDHPDSAVVVDKLHLYNETLEDLRLESVTLLHHPLDDFAGEFQADFEAMVGDPLDGGDYVAPATSEDWDGRLPAQSVTLLRVRVGHAQLPLMEQAFVLRLSNGEERVYRFVYQDANGQSLVEVIDPADPQLVAEVLYEGTSALDPEAGPRTSALGAAYPNPFNPSTRIPYNLTRAGDVRLDVFDVAGRRVATLVDGMRPAGTHVARFDGSRLASGVYLCRLTAEGRTTTSKLALLK